MTDARPYRVDITVDGHRESIGSFATAEEGALMYARARRATTKREVEVVRKRAAADELGRERKRRVDEAARQRAEALAEVAHARAQREAERAAQMAAVETARANKEKARAAADERRQARQAAAAQVRSQREALRAARIELLGGDGAAPRRVGRAPEAAAR